MQQAGAKWMPSIAAGFTLVILSIVLAADMGWGANLFSWVAHIPGRDFTGHFLLIGLLTLTVNLALRRRRIERFGMHFQVGSLIVLPVVTLEEFSQLWISTRGFSPLDLAADYLGIWLLGGVLSSWLRRKPGSAEPPAVDLLAEESEAKR
jgi:hypothetical protein